MTTTYTGIPTLEERVVAATLVILGRVEKVLDVTTDYRQQEPQVRTTFRVAVDSILKGKTDAEAVEVKVAGGKTEAVETPWSVALKEGDQVLLMLSPNYADHTPDVYVPYFGSSYPVTGEGEVELSEDVSKELDQKRVPLQRGRAKLADLRRLVDDVVQRQAKEDDLLAGQEPEEYRKLPYREIQEMPNASPGGPLASAPERGEEPGKKPE
jgi:hypothetical protein